MSKIGKKILDRLGGFVDAMEKGQALGERFTCRKIELNLIPEKYMWKYCRAKPGQHSG